MILFFYSLSYLIIQTIGRKFTFFSFIQKILKELPVSNKYIHCCFSKQTDQSGELRKFSHLHQSFLRCRYYQIFPSFLLPLSWFVEISITIYIFHQRKALKYDVCGVFFKNLQQKVSSTQRYQLYQSLLLFQNIKKKCNSHL